MKKFNKNSIIYKIKKYFKSPDQNHRLITFLRSNVAGYFPSYALSMSDEQYQPNKKLFELSLAAIQLALKVDLSENRSLFPHDKKPQPDVLKYVNVYPGEHYRLIAAIVDLLKPEMVVEIGTYRGLSALSMKTFLRPDASIITYDVIPWYKISDTSLQRSDFDTQLKQRVYDLAQNKVDEAEIDILKKADIIFVDANKDFIMERKFCALFDSISFNNPPIIIFDDIKMVSMIELWRRIPYPKIDVTSFGHWSGTGIVEWKNSKNDQLNNKQWINF